ncbi:serine hydrolase domain-containing protein [Streptomyces orinoci]|uniref:Serine hydrolase domain-containing protein n=1 Tax=Streptomyces orinoci TaxID=67339 RepID=A0ABV3JTS0_STRON|nr:serine hydrolase domain-containing protein [Streptomyces orinoci]
MKPSRTTTAVTTLLAATVLAATAAPAVAAQAHHRSVDRTALQRALDRLAADGVPGAVAEVRDEHGVWSGSAGREDLRSRQRPSADDRFRAGSVTKSLVATVVLQLVAEKKIGLDDRIDRYLPGLIPADHYGRQITVRQLLHHTSGLPDFLDVLRNRLMGEWHGDFTKLRTEHYTHRQLVSMALTLPSEFKPGEKGKWEYSNTNYVVLGLLVERVTGHSLGQQVDQRVIRPLHLKNTSMPATSRIDGRHLHGYQRFPRPTDPFADITEYDPNVFWGPGNVVSNAHDLNTFYRALMGGKLLPAKLNKEMRNVTPDGADRPGRYYGLGLEGTTEYTRARAYGHTGSVPGYLTYSFVTGDGKRQVTLALGSNLDLSPNPKAADDARAFLKTALNGK